MNKQSFRNWLSANTSIKPGNVKKYSNRVDEFTREDRAQMFHQAAFDIYNPIYRDLVVEIEQSQIFQEINQRAHREYSSGLNYFKVYQDLTVADNDDDYLSIGSEPALKPITTSDKPHEIPKQIVGERVQFSRNKATSVQALANAGYACEFDATHESFISRFTGKMYVEAHHLVPLSNQNQFEYSLDVLANIVSLCPNCHKTVHFGNEKEVIRITNHLLLKRESRLNSSNIDVDSARLKSFYI